ncbi:MerR family transcriptional regulator [Kocuria marina]|uniref:MerR family transcriptional regulator n=1 Tax=Kocuria marina TaxID=223184 RepID=UPI003460532C
MTTEGSTPQKQCSTGIQGAPAWYTEEQIVRAVPAERARRLLEATLRSGFRPEDDPARSNVPAGEGHLLLMPSVIGDWAGIKVASVSPGNPERDLPRIQATYMLMDSATLSLRALLEGNVLTTLRTPAISAVATDYLAPKEATKLVVFGTGPQALAHIAAFAEIRSFTEVVVCGRTPRKVDAAVDYARTLGLAARSGDASEVRDADVVVCTTSAAEPLFDGALVPDTACVVAMGSHEHVPPAHSDVAVQDPPHGQPHREERERGESVQPRQAVGVDEGCGIQRAIRTVDASTTIRGGCVILLNALAEVSNTTTASIKFYRREGLLPAGTRLAATRQDYDRGHAERLQLIRVLREEAGATIPDIRALVTLIDDPRRAPRGRPRNRPGARRGPVTCRGQRAPGAPGGSDDPGHAHAAGVAGRGKRAAPGAR